MSKRLMVLAGIVAAVVLGGAVAFAQTARPTEDETTLSGKGFLNGSGSGSIQLEMGGTLRLAAEGDVIIVDRAGDARVHIATPGADSGGTEELTGDTTYRLEGFQGVVRLAGSGFTVEVEGFVVFKARGEGTARLAGEGIWRTRHDRGFWDTGGIRLSLAD